MKVLVFVAIACLLSGAQAGGFLDALKQIGQGFTDTFNHLVTDLKQPVTDLAGTLIDNLKTAGSSLLATGATSLLGSLSHLGETPTTRELSVLNEVMNFVEEGKQVVARLSEALGGLYHSAITRLNEIAQTIQSLDFLKEPLDKILSEISKVVDIHSIMQSSIMKSLSTNPFIKAAEGLISHLGHKRSALFDTVTSLGQQFISLFKPVVDAVTEHVHQLGTTLSQSASALFGAVKPVLGNLAGELSSHVQGLKDSATALVTGGQQALKSLSGAVGDMMSKNRHIKPRGFITVSTKDRALTD